MGPEYSIPRGAGFGVFGRASIGLGRVTTAGRRGTSFSEDLGEARLERRTETGIAGSGAAGVRLVLPPGPLGFTIAVHGARTVARRSGCGSMGIAFGLTLYPLARDVKPEQLDAVVR